MDFLPEHNKNGDFAPNFCVFREYLGGKGLFVDEFGMDERWR